MLPVRRGRTRNVERVIGSIRRVLREYVGYYHGSRTHLGLMKDCPEPREIEPPELGLVSSRPVLGGLHHRYFRQAA